MQISEWYLCCRLFYISKTNHGHYSNNMDTAKNFLPFCMKHLMFTVKRQEVFYKYPVGIWANKCNLFTSLYHSDPGSFAYRILFYHPTVCFQAGRPYGYCPIPPIWLQVLQLFQDTSVTNLLFQTGH